MRKVVVTGIGVISPIGIGTQVFWDNLLSGTSGVAPISAFDPREFASKIAGQVPAYKVGDYVPKSYRKATKVMARDIKLAVIAAYHAVRDAGLVTKCIADRGEASGPVNVDSTRFGANIGAGLICADLTELAGALASAAE